MIDKNKIKCIGKNLYIAQSVYDNTHKDYKGVWTTERYDWDDWEEVREQYIGKRTWMPPFYVFNCTCLCIEGQNFEIIPDENWEEFITNNK